MPELLYKKPSVIYDVRGDKAIQEDNGVIISRQAAVEAYRALRAVSDTEQYIARHAEPGNVLGYAMGEFLRAVDPDLYEDL